MNTVVKNEARSTSTKHQILRSAVLRQAKAVSNYYWVLGVMGAQDHRSIQLENQPDSTKNG